MNRTRLTVALFAATGLALTACGSDTDSALPGLPGSPSASADPAAGNPVVAPSDETGSCHVSVTGDVNAEWTSPGGYSSVGYGPWTPTQPGVTMPMAMDETFFILNCQGDGENYVGFGPRVDQSIPMQPATYVIEAGDNVFGASEAGIMTVLIGLDGTDTNWGPSEAGEIVITEFDATHIAGTFRLTVTDVLASIGGTPSKGTAVITGEFNYANPNL